MTDIVDLLRSPEVFISDGSMNSAVAHEAAYTIEWLREDLHMWRSRSDMWYAENVKKQAACEQMGARIVALEAQLAEAIERGNDWCDQAQKARKEVAGAMILVDMLRDAALGHQERAERLRAALRRISLASQNSGTTKEFLGREARVALGEDINDRHH